MYVFARRIRCAGETGHSSPLRSRVPEGQKHHETEMSQPIHYERLGRNQGRRGLTQQCTKQFRGSAIDKDAGET